MQIGLFIAALESYCANYSAEQIRDHVRDVWPEVSKRISSETWAKLADVLGLLLAEAVGSDFIQLMQELVEKGGDGDEREVS